MKYSSELLVPLSISFFVSFVLADLPSLIPDEMIDNCKGKVECNDGMEKVVIELSDFIKKISPIKEVNSPFCYELIVTGTYTIFRGGDVYSCPLNDENDCSIQKIDICFQFMNFTCEANVEKIMEYVQKATEKMEGKRKRSPFGPPMGPPMGMPDVKKMKGNILGHWLDLCIVGKMRLCKKDNSKNEAEGLHLKNFNYDSLTLSCNGSPELMALCEGDDAREKVKESIGGTLQPMLCNNVAKGIKEGPADIATKFSCNYANSKTKRDISSDLH